MERPRQARRRCLMCRREGAKREFARFCVFEGRFVWDEAMSLGGRGAYVHRTHECVSKATNPERWARALKVECGALDMREFSRLRDAVIC